MAQGLFSSGTTSVARPTEPSTAASTGDSTLSTSDVTVTYTPALIGAAATSFVVTATNNTSAVVTSATTVLKTLSRFGYNRRSGRFQ